MASSYPKFPLSLRLLHWGMALIIVSLISAGLTMVESLEPWQLTLLQLHKGFGVTGFVLVLIRIGVRVSANTPALPEALPAWQARIARGSHLVLYALMLLMPLSGYLMQYFAARPVDVFGLFSLPVALYPNIERFALFRELHGWAAYLFIGVIVLHAGAALHHHFVRKDSVLKSML